MSISNPFGSEKVIESLSLPRVFSVSQEIAVRLWGNVNPYFYVSGEIHNTNVDSFILEYLPLNLRIGTVQLKVPGSSIFSVMGLSSPNFSVGQLRGYRKVVNFTVERMRQTFFLGSVAYGSVKVYLNGFLLSPSQYTLNYKDGILTIPEAVPSDIVTIEFQSLTNSCPFYALSAQKNFKILKKQVELGLTVISSTISDNQYFLFSKAKDDGFTFSNWLNIEKAISFKMELSKKFSLFGMSSILSVYFNSKNFREPMGIPKEESFSFDLASRNQVGSVDISSNLNEMNVSVKNKAMGFLFKVGKTDNLFFRAAVKNIRVGFDFGKDKMVSFQEVNLGNFSAFFDQDFLSKKYSANFSLDDPITLEASVTSSTFGMKVSKKFGKFGFSSDYHVDKTTKNEEFNFDLNGKWVNIPLQWKIGLHSKNEKNGFSASADFSSFYGDLSTTFDASGITFDWKNEIASVGIAFQKDLARLYGSLTKKIGDWKGSLSVTTGVKDGEIGGSVSLKIWRNEF
jgi:hypothetical protein